VAHLDLRNAIHVGHSTGGGEVMRYIARHGEGRVAKAAIFSAIPPLMVQTPSNPGGLPKKVFDDLQAALAANRSQFYLDIASGPFYGFNRPGAKVSEGLIRNWWRQGMMGGAKAHYDGIVAFSQTDQTEDLKKINVPVLVGHGDDDQIVPYANAGPLSAKLLKKGTLKTYKGFPHGMPFTEPATINADCWSLSKARGTHRRRQTVQQPTARLLGARTSACASRLAWSNRFIAGHYLDQRSPLVPIIRSEPREAKR
jgi:non-heme chloroperoxidase